MHRCKEVINIIVGMAGSRVVLQSVVSEKM